MKLDRSNIEAWLLDRIEGRLTPAQERELTAFLLAHPDLAEELGELPEVEKPTVTFTGKDALKRTLPPTGEVNAANLDEFLVARSEGDLDASRQSELERYVAAHPAAAKAARQMNAAYIQRGPDIFPDKTSIVRAFPPQGLPDRHRIDDFLVAKLHGELGTDQERAVDAIIADDTAAARAWAIVQRTRIVPDAVAFNGKAALKKKGTKVIPLWSRPAVRYAAAASVALLLGLWWMARDGKPEERLANDQPVKEEARPTSPVSSPANTGGTPGDAVEQTDGGNPDPKDNATEGEKLSVPSSDRPATPAIRRSAPAHLERIDPLVASIGHEPSLAGPFSGGEVPQVPISHDAPEAAPGPQYGNALSVGELLASAVRTGVLDRPAEEARTLDRTDAVALVDKGLQAFGGNGSGLDVQRTAQRRRFNLRLGQGLTLTGKRVALTPDLDAFPFIQIPLPLVTNGSCGCNRRARSGVL